MVLFIEITVRNAMLSLTWIRALQYISEADTMIIGGTSLVVYPAAGLIRYFRGRKLVVINMSPTQSDSNADLLIADKIGDVLGSL